MLSGVAVNKGFGALRSLHHGIDGHPAKAIVGNGTIGPACQHIALMPWAVIPDLYGQICSVGAHEDIFSHPVGTAAVAVVGRDLLDSLCCDFIEWLAPQERVYVVFCQEPVL